MRSAVLASLLLAPVALAQSSASAISAGSSAVSAASSVVSSAAPSGTGSSSADYLTQVLAALTQAGLTGLVGVASAIANTTDGAALLGGLATGNHTVFAPSNDAFSAVPQNVSSNTTLLTQILSYHITNRSYTANGTSVTPNHTIARTLLRGGGYSLPGNFSAPLVFARANASATTFNIIQATNNFSAGTPVAAANLLVHVIPSVISLPPTIASAATVLFPQLAGVIVSSGLLDPLAAAQGITVFAPNDAAVAAVASQLPSLGASVGTVLANHVINGSVVYSTGLAAANYTSAGGQPFSFISNSSGAYVTSGNSTAKIVQSDIIIANGVVHLIDGILLNAQNNTAAAASAASSGLAAAASSTEATGAVTATSTAGASGSGSASGSAASGSASSTSKAAAGTVAAFNMNGAIGAAVAVLGAVIGGGFVLA